MAIIFLISLKLASAQSDIIIQLYQNRFFFLIAAIVLLSLVFLIVTIVEHSYRKKMFDDLGKFSRKKYYHDSSIQLEKDLEDKPAHEVLTNLDNLAKHFFQEFFKLNPSMSYEEISEEIKDNKIAGFCNLMSHLLYSSEVPSNNQLFTLIDKFKDLIDLEYVRPAPIQMPDKETIKKHNLSVIEQAKNFINEARLHGFKDSQLINIFIQKGWNKDTINKLLVEGHIPIVEKKPLPLTPENLKINKLEFISDALDDKQKFSNDKYKPPKKDKLFY